MRACGVSVTFGSSCDGAEAWAMECWWEVLPVLQEPAL